MITLRGMAMPFRISNGGVQQCAGSRKVADDLRHLLSTRAGERIARRGYGGGVHQWLQEPEDSALRALIRHEIEQALRTHLPQARLLGPVRLAQADGQLTVTIDYRIDPAIAAAAGAERIELAIPTPQ